MKRARTTVSSGHGLSHGLGLGGGLVVSAVCLAVGAGGCGSSIVHARADASTLAPNIAAVVALPPRLGFGRGADQRRAARRTGDLLIQATGGHAILAEELRSTDPELIADSVRAMGEDPRRTLTFAVIASRQDRVETAGLPTPGARFRPVRRFSDFTVRLDVRCTDRPEVIGSVEAFATAFTNGPEIDDAGKPMGLQRAIADAIDGALKRFAPGLVATTPFPTIVETPLRTDSTTFSGALAAVDRLRRLQVLYPERSSDDLATLASSNARFLIVEPGRLASVGVAAGDLVSELGGRTLGSRAALARTLARGDVPAMSIDRAGGRFLVGQTLVARAK